MDLNLSDKRAFVTGASAGIGFEVAMILAREGAQLAVAATREGHDDRDENYRHVRALLDKHPDIIGIYNVGGASDGIGRALVESGRARDVTFVGHGLTPDTRAMLQDGTMDVVITQSPTVLFETALRAACEDTDHAVAMELYLSENLPMA